MKKYLFMIACFFICNAYSMESAGQTNQSELQTSDHEIVNAMSFCIEYLLQEADSQDRAEIEQWATTWKSLRPKMDAWFTKNPAIEQQILNEHDVQVAREMLKIALQQKKNAVKKELLFNNIS